MKRLFPHPVRQLVRLGWLGGALLGNFLLYLPTVVLRRGRSLTAARAQWLHHTAARLGRVFGLEVRASGPLPRSGLLVANHLSYVDILMIGSLAPAVFVAKSEIRSWPVFGWFARLAGTRFVRRERRGDVELVGREIQGLLAEGLLVVLFAEGTSSGGATVLPFRSSLLEPVAGQPHPVCAAYLSYRLAAGDVSEEVCYWKDMRFVPHFLRLLAQPRVQGSIAFQPVSDPPADRKELARQLHAEVLKLKAAAERAMTS